MNQPDQRQGAPAAPARQESFTRNTIARRLCYRHRPDLTQNRPPDYFSFHDVQQQIECLPTSDQAAISHIWSLFAQAGADQRTLILKGLLSTCCTPQLSFLYDEIRPLLRIDFACILPREVCLRALSFLDAKSLCHAAQVSRLWKSLADDDALWHRMCEQHIDRICTKCGWGLPLLDKPAGKQPPPADRMKQGHADVLPLPTDPTPSGKPSPRLPSQHLKRMRLDEPGSSQPSRMMMTDDGDDGSDDDVMAERGHQPWRQRRQRRPWKDVYSERLAVERNWRRNRHRMRQLRHSDSVMCVQLCETSNVLMTGSFDRTVRVWNLETGEVVRQLTGHTHAVLALQFDRLKLVTGAMDNTLKIWDWHRGRCIRTLEGHTDAVLALHFDCRLLVSGSGDCTIRVWNFAAGECCTLTGHDNLVNSVRIHNSHTLVSASDDRTIRLWDLDAKSCLRVLGRHACQVLCALPSARGVAHLLPPPACSTDSHHADEPVIISGAFDHTIKFWDFGGSCLRTLFGHVDGIWSVAFDSLRLVSGSHDKTVRVWDMESGKCMYVLAGHASPVTAVAMSDTKIVSASEDGEVRIWDFGVAQ